MAGIADLIAAGKDMGIFEFYLPFVIMFAVLYGLLGKSKIFGDSEKDRKVRAINLIIALAASVFVMAYTPVGITLTTFFSNLFTNALIAIVTMLVFLMLVSLILGAFGGEMKLEKGVKFVVLFLVILVVGIFISSGGLAFFPGLTLGTVSDTPTLVFPELNLTTQDVAIIVLVVLTGIVIFYVTKGEGGGKREASGRGLDIRRS